MAYDRVESTNTLVKRSTEELTFAVDLAAWGLLESDETISSVLPASIISGGGSATISGGPTFAGSVISLVLDGGAHGDPLGKILIAYVTNKHARREVVGQFLVRDSDP